MVSMEEFLKLKNRVEKLEKERDERRNKEVEWALCQFRYMKHTKEQSKALDILERELGND